MKYVIPYYKCSQVNNYVDYRKDKIVFIKTKVRKDFQEAFEKSLGDNVEETSDDNEEFDEDNLE